MIPTSRINDVYDIGAAFAAMEDELIASMIRNMKRHKVEEVKEEKQWSMWQAEQLKSLEQYKKANRKKYGKQFCDINAKIGELIRIARAEGEMNQEAAILDAIKKGFPARKSAAGATAEFFRINDRKLDALIKATTKDMQRAETAILRMANDQYRKVIFNAQVYANTGAGTYEKAVDMATKDLLSSGLNCVEYKNGARHTLADYADMAIQTASKRAYLTGEGEKRQEWGISTVIMNKRGNPCPKCLPFVRKVLIDDVWSGGSRKDGKYPLMSSAIAAGLYHPRCKDSHTTYFPGISTPPNDKISKKELTEIEAQNAQETKKQNISNMVQKFKRLEDFSLDDKNKLENRLKKKQYIQKMEILEAKRFTNKDAADAYHRPKTEKIWSKLTDEEKIALWKYTGSTYEDMNGVLRSGDKPVSFIRDYIDNMTKGLSKCKLDDAVWVRRGISRRGLEKFLEIETSGTVNELIGKTVIEKGFMSTGVSSDAGFSGINIEIYLPKGTQAIYAEPFSQFGGTNSGGNWDGKKQASYIGGEAELIVQRGSEFEIKDIEMDEAGNIKNVVLHLVRQI